MKAHARLAPWLARRVLAPRVLAPRVLAPRVLALEVLALGMLALGSACAGPRVSLAERATEPAPARFATPEEAADALAKALRVPDRAALADVLGPSGVELFLDDGADERALEAFTAAYDERRELARDAGGRATLLVGEERWALPVPLVRRGDGWSFDAGAARAVIALRDNELAAIETCRALVEEPLARAAALDASARPEPAPPPTPVALYEAGPLEHAGYRFRWLTGQGRCAPGGARDYAGAERDAGAARGCAIVAWPVDYGASGRSTFIACDNGVVYRRDLGPDTERIASAMTTFDPDLAWELAP